MIFLATQNLLYGLTEREEVEVTDLMFNIEAAVKYISENKYSIAQKLLEDVNFALIPYKKDLFCGNMSRFTLGLLLHQSGKTAEGKAKMESSIRLFDELGLPEMKAYYQKIFDESVKN